MVTPEAINSSFLRSLRMADTSANSFLLLTPKDPTGVLQADGFDRQSLGTENSD